jgi:TRAP-type mannitol/chloroaromatic compound transport system permease large subunit
LSAAGIARRGEPADLLHHAALRRLVSMSDVYRGMWPFVAIQILGLMLCLAFSEIILSAGRAGPVMHR